MKTQEVGRFHTQERSRGGPGSREGAGDRQGTPGDKGGKSRKRVFHRMCVYIRIYGWGIWPVCSRGKPHGEVSHGALGRWGKLEGFKNHPVEKRRQSGGSAVREDAERGAGNRPWWAPPNVSSLQLRLKILHGAQEQVHT